jgi:Ca2+-binding RTX toxin-like protein
MSIGDFAEATEFSLPDENGLARLGQLPSAVVLAAVPGAPVEIPGAGWMLSADFARHGDDLLLVGADGKEVIVKSYFNMATPPNLVTSNGAMLDGALVVRLAGPLAPAQYAQAGPATGAAAGEAIGRIETAEGTVEAIRTDGSRVTLARGDAIFQGDTIETADNAAVGIVFADTTTFSLGASGRMVLDEMVYDPGAQTGSFKMQIVLGVFSFVSGQIAKSSPEGMTVSTPVAVLGIRGTAVAGRAAPEGQENLITLLPNADGTVGEVIVSNGGGIQVLNVIGATTTPSSFNTPPPPPRPQTQAEAAQIASVVANVPVQPDVPPPADAGTDPIQDATDGTGEPTPDAPPEGADGQTEANLPPVDALLDFFDLALEQGLEQFETFNLSDLSFGPDLNFDSNFDPPPDILFDPDDFVDFIPPLGETEDATLIGSSGDDFLVGSGADNTFIATLGNDTIIAGGGNDTLDIGSNIEIENAVIDFTTGNLTFTIVEKDHTTPLYSLLISNHVADPISTIKFLDDGISEVLALATSLDASTSTVDTGIAGTTGNDTLQGGSGNDFLLGNSGDDLLEGNAGDDIFFGGSGNNTFHGGTGTDEIYFFDPNNTQGAVIDIGSGSGTNGFGGSAVFSDIEDLRGTDFADTFIGNSSVNTIDGEGGNDTLTGGGGADFLKGDSGNDTFAYTAISDSANGSGNHDTILDFNAGGSSSSIDIIKFSSGFGSLTTVSFFGDENSTFGSSSGNIEVRFNDSTKLLQVDGNDDGTIDMEIGLSNVSIANLDNTDFVAVV